MAGLLDIAQELNKVVLYHGTKESKFQPRADFHNPENDYGSGLYTTKDLNLAKEWAMSTYASGVEGYVYEYSIDTKDLKVLDLTKANSLYWLAILLYNRRPEFQYGIQEARADALIQRYLVDITPYDIIKGYRADDSYYTYAKDFVSGNISKECLDKALYLGKLGIQYCLKSRRAFDLLECKQVHKVEPKYRDRFRKRDSEARREYAMLSKRGYGSTYIDKFI